MEKDSRIMEAEEGAKYSTQFMKPVLHMIGVWPTSPNSSYKTRILQTMKNLVSMFLFLLVLGPCFLRMFLKEKTGKKKISLFAPITSSSMQFCKYTLLLLRMKEFREGLDEIRQDWIEASEENRQIFLAKAKLGRKMMIILTITMYSGGTCYRAILPLLRGNVVTPDNITIRPLPCPSYFVFLDEQVTPNYEIIFVLQILSGFLTFTIICASCAISALLVLHACSMLKILENKIKKLADESEKDDIIVQSKLVDIVEYQTKIRKFVKNAQAVTEYICLADMFGGTCLICLEGYYFFMEWEDNNTTAIVVSVTLFTSCTFCVFMLCYIGQLLVDKYNSVGQTSCTMNWYRLKNKHARCLILIIAMSNYPVKLTAGKVIELSFSTFSDVMKLSLGYLNMLRRLI